MAIIEDRVKFKELFTYEDFIYSLLQAQESSQIQLTNLKARLEQGDYDEILGQTKAELEKKASELKESLISIELDLVDTKDKKRKMLKEQKAIIDKYNTEAKSISYDNGKNGRKELALGDKLLSREINLLKYKRDKKMIDILIVFTDKSIYTLKVNLTKEVKIAEIL